MSYRVLKRDDCVKPRDPIVSVVVRHPSGRGNRCLDFGLTAANRAMSFEDCVSKIFAPAVTALNKNISTWPVPQLDPAEVAKEVLSAYE